MITLEQAKEIWADINVDSYTEQDVNERMDFYTLAVTRTYETDEGTFTAIGSLVGDDFDYDEVEFDGKDGESYKVFSYR